MRLLSQNWRRHMYSHSAFILFSVILAATANAELKHKYNFNDGTANDAVGNADFTLNGTATVTGGALMLPGGNHLTNYASAEGAALDELWQTLSPPDTSLSNAISMEVWFEQSATVNWSKLFMAGIDVGGAFDYMDITPVRGDGTGFSSASLNSGGFNGNAEDNVQTTSAITDGINYYLAAIWDNTALNAVSAGTLTIHLGPVGGALETQSFDLGFENFLSGLAKDPDNASLQHPDFRAYLGAAVQFGDRDFNGSISEFRIYDSPLTPSEIEASFATGADPFGGPQRSDLNFDGNIDALDWPLFLSGTQIDMSGLSADDAYRMGDLNGDFQNDYTDFQIFASDFNAANGPGAFSSLVPEPSALALAMMGLVLLLKQSRGKRIATLLIMMLGLFCCLSESTMAEIRHEYNFDVDGTDSVGTADLELLGSASWGGGTLNLPGGAARTSSATATGAALTELAESINGSDTLSVVVQYNTAFAQTWAKVFMAGTPGGEPDLSYLDITPQRGNDQNFGTTFNDNTANEIGVNGLPLVADGVDAVAIAIYDELTDSITLHRAEYGDADSIATGQGPLGGRDLGDVTVTEFYLGSAVNFADADFEGTINQFQMYDHALSEREIQLLVSPDPSDQLLTLEVDGTSGTTRLVNNTPDTHTINYYEVRSPDGTLNATGWNSLSDQNVDAVGGGPGQTWDESAGADANILSEYFLLGDTTLAPGATLSLGDAFDPATFDGQEGDLSFRFANDGADLTSGFVKYVVGGGLACDLDADGECDQQDLQALYANGTNVPGISTWLSQASDPANPYKTASGGTASDVYILGDVNLDGDVNSTDLGLLLNNFGSDAAVEWNGGDLNADSNVNSADLGLLLNNFGSTSLATAVPEPEGFQLLLFASMAMAIGFARRLTPRSA